MMSINWIFNLRISNCERPNINEPSAVPLDASCYLDMHGFIFETSIWQDQPGILHFSKTSVVMLCESKGISMYASFVFSWSHRHRPTHTSRGKTCLQCKSRTSVAFKWGNYRSTGEMKKNKKKTKKKNHW